MSHLVIIIQAKLSGLLVTGADRAPFRLECNHTQDVNGESIKAGCGTENMNETHTYSFQFIFHIYI